MAGMTIAFGALIALVGFVNYDRTAYLHPIVLGALLAFLGVLALAMAAQRKLWMHLAVTAGLIELVLAVINTVKAYGEQSPEVPRIFLHEPMLLAILSLVFVLLCVWSFISARRGRNAQA